MDRIQPGQKIGFGLTITLGLLLTLASGQAQATKGKKYALVVGITEYESSRLPSLRYTEKDAQALARVLKEAGFDDVKVLVSSNTDGNKPTAANLRAALEALLKGKTKRDTVLVALAGHGVQLEVRDPKGDLPARSYAYFCPSDADLNDVKYSTGQSSTMLNLDDLFRILGDSNPGAKLVLMDACRNELGVTAATRSLASARVTVPDGVLALFSCGKKQVAWESARLEHGVFFHYVLEGLRGKAANAEGEVDWALLTSYVTRQVPENVSKYVDGGATQNPSSYGSFEGRSPLLVAPGSSIARTPAPKRDPAGLASIPPPKVGVKTPSIDRVVPPKGSDGPGTLTSSVTGMKLVPIVKKGKPVRFLMGSPATEDDHDSGEEQHEVELTRPFWLGMHEVTQKQFKEVMGYNPSYCSRDGKGKAGIKYDLTPGEGKELFDALGVRGDTEDYPVDNVSWNEAIEFCKKLSAREPGRLYRLPTEAEWEYACRGGATRYQAYHVGDTLLPEHARFNRRPPMTCKVGSFKPNAFGLYDMHGNVWEWCQDYNDDRGARRGRSKLVRDPQGPSTPTDYGRGSFRIRRGGGWLEKAASCRSAHRSDMEPDFRNCDQGFRVAVTVTNP